ncbi:MAG: DNA integrity scanning diadenylate cyclase DisA [Acidimicrobiia bacterium]|nr:DNA integrity scanning diadenylate cyclase DisA [Acidimicrobiia bacterium]
MAGNRNNLELLRRFAPGTALRHAVDLILAQGTGALIVIGGGSVVEGVSSGGFPLVKVPFTAQRVAELAKMDGGIVIDTGAEAVLAANIHFVPDSAIPTEETGTRHRTAQRLAVQTKRPVLAVSDTRGTAIVYVGKDKHEVQEPEALTARSNEVLNSMERLRRRVDDAALRLTRFEVDDVVVNRDVVLLLQRAGLVRRLNIQLAGLIVQLGGESQLIDLQAQDLVEGVDDLVRTVYADYAKRRPRNLDKILSRLDGLSLTELYDPPLVASEVDLTPLDGTVRPRGLRALERVPRLPDTVRDALLSHFKDFHEMLRAPQPELAQVEGVGRHRARQLRSYFDRLLESTDLREVEEG